MKSTYLIILSSLFLLSCTNFLDEESTGTMSIDSNLSSVESCTALANSTMLIRMYLMLMKAHGEEIRFGFWNS